MTKKILIIGNSAKAYALAKKMSEENEVFVAPGSSTMLEFAKCVDIREDSCGELLEFVLENCIDLTIPVSLKSIKSGVADLFNQNGQQIFAPSAEVSNLLFDKPSMKRLLYKLRIPTPKFGIFEKQNMAYDYIKNFKLPFVIKTNEPSSAIVLTSPSVGKRILDSYFVNKNQKVVIEDYIWGSPFVYYVLTDGYKALPIGSSMLYMYSLEGDGGQLTGGMGACSPNYKLSLENEYFIMDNVVYPLLEYLADGDSSYLGVMGVKGVIADDGSINILGFSPFMQDCDCTAILENLDSDLNSLVESCVLGLFSDEVEEILLKDRFSTSLVLTCKNKENGNNSIYGLELLDEDMMVDFYPNVHKNKYLELEVSEGEVLVLTARAGTVAAAINKAYQEAKCIDFKGLNLRKDICKPISNDYIL